VNEEEIQRNGATAQEAQKSSAAVGGFTAKLGAV